MPAESAVGPDRRLDILVLGPMSEDESTAASCVPVQRAVEALFRTPEFESLFDRIGLRRQDRKVHVPERIGGQDIIHGVLTRLDVADLVIFNLTPKPGRQEASANVFYELGLVHALGIPAMFVIQDGVGDVPFYAREMHQVRVRDFQEATVAAGLRGMLYEFLSGEDAHNNYCNDRVTQFYDLPIVDITAAVGLATGYYFNFVSRLIREAGVLTSQPDLIRHVIVVRPSAINSTYPADLADLKAALAAAGHQLRAEKIDPPPGDKLGPLWFEHVRGIVIDIPRTIYPLQRAPRLLAYQRRHQTLRGAEAERTFEQRLGQFSEQLIERFMAGIRFQVRVDGMHVRARMLHFASIPEVVPLVGRLPG